MAATGRPASGFDHLALCVIARQPGMRGWTSGQVLVDAECSVRVDWKSSNDARTRLVSVAGTASPASRLEIRPQRQRGSHELVRVDETKLTATGPVKAEESN